MLKKIAIGLAALALPFSASTATAGALSSTYSEVHFYSDSQMTEEIGGFIHYCDGSTVTWGEVFTSHYFTEDTHDCGD